MRLSFFRESKAWLALRRRGRKTPLLVLGITQDANPEIARWSRDAVSTCESLNEDAHQRYVFAEGKITGPLGNQEIPVIDSPSCGFTGAKKESVEDLLYLSMGPVRVPVFVRDPVDDVFYVADLRVANRPADERDSTRSMCFRRSRLSCSSFAIRRETKVGTVSVDTQIYRSMTHGLASRTVMFITRRCCRRWSGTTFIRRFHLFPGTSIGASLMSRHYSENIVIGFPSAYMGTITITRNSAMSAQSAWTNKLRISGKQSQEWRSLVS